MDWKIQVVNGNNTLIRNTLHRFCRPPRVGTATTLKKLPAAPASGIYPVKAKFDHKEQALRGQSIQPLVMIYENTYPMDRTRMLSNRWETLIPVPAGQGEIYYRFKFDYEINTFSGPRKDSKLSST